ncbi:MAG: DUF4229 domain-containing protein [Actinomycetales bacterium]|nr:DUF4229 domain-containing protein [Actinomycetales bacterium]
MALVRYSLVRLLLLLAAAVALYLLGLRGALLWVVAVVVAALVAFITLPRAHDRAAADLARLVRRGRPGDEDERHEDARLGSQDEPGSED